MENLPGTISLALSLSHGFTEKLTVIYLQS